MISRFARMTNAALRERFSTVIILTLLLTVIRAVQDWGLLDTEPTTFFTKLFATLIISFAFSLVVHLALYLIFSPKPREEEPILEVIPLKEDVMEAKPRAAKKVAKKRVTKKKK